MSTPRVRLRSWVADDVAWIVPACRDPEIARWTRIPSPYGDEDALEFLARVERTAANGTEAQYAIEAEIDGTWTPAGSVGLLGIGEGEAEAGYWVAPELRDRGIASSALALIVAVAFEELGLGRVWLQVLEGNAASERVAEAAGFAREGRRPATHCGVEGQPVTVFGLPARD